MDEEDANGHYRDDTGTCIYCGRCDSAACCPQEPRRHSLTRAFRDSSRRIIRGDDKSPETIGG